MTSRAPTILLSANSCWNLVNFRGPLISALQGRGYQVAAAAPADSGAEALRQRNVEVHDLSMNSRGTSPVADLGLLIRYLRLLHRTRPSAFLGFTAKPNIYGSLAAGWLNIPSVATITGLGTSFLSNTRLQLAVSHLYRIALRRSARIFFHNEEDLRQFVDGGMAPAATSQVVAGSGVDIDYFAPRPKASSEPTTFLFVGRLLMDKGAIEFAQAAAIAKAEIGGRFQMLGDFAGDHPRGVPRESLAPFAADGTIEILGSADDVRPFIAAADCVVLPSYREGLPRALLEAGAMERPVIATDVPGCRQVVETGSTGLICKARSPSALAEAMIAMARKPDEERVAMGRSGRKRVAARFSTQQVVDAYLKVLAELGLEP